MRAPVLAVLALVGCTDDNPPIERGVVTVHVVRDELPVREAAVVFHDASGHVLSSARSDANGVVVGEISTWGMVTVVDPDLAHRLTTITRVAIGSTLEVPLTPVQNPGPEVGTLTINAPTSPPPADTFQYDVQTPCGNTWITALPATMPLYSGCGVDIPVLLTARTMNQSLEDPGHALAYAAGYAANRVFAPSAWSTSCAQVALTTDVSMQVQLWPRLGGHAFRWADTGFCAYAPPAQPTLDFGEGAIASVFSYVDGSPNRTTSLLRDFTDVPASLQITSGTDLLIGDVDARIDATGATWTEDAALADTDTVDATLTWSVTAQDYVVWRFVLPRDATRAVVPELPDELDGWGALANANDVIVELRYVDASWLDNLDAVHRELPLLLDGGASKRDLPRGSTLRDFVEKIYPDASP
ncbi:MAG TPA: hypothetical protein VIV40_40895 [Kofleriaceae bacterium]